MKMDKHELIYYTKLQYNRFIATYGLKYALHIVKDMSKMLNQEKKRRKEIEPMVKQLKKMYRKEM